MDIVFVASGSNYTLSNGIYLLLPQLVLISFSIIGFILYLWRQ